MIHYGDITKLSGYDLPPVDVVTGGSPCQDLSVAGKRAGLEGERSGLFMEQVRIVKEMRQRDRDNGISDEFIRPRFMVWENLPSADVQPVRHGHWIIKDNPGTGWYRVTCSECGEDVTSVAPVIGFFPNARVTWDFCPNCGADMRGEG